MHISHIAIWTTRLEELRNFYITYFNGTSNEKYINPKKGFESYFISLIRDLLLWKLCKDKISQHLH